MKKKWFEVYDEIARLLADEYYRNNEKGFIGEILYNKFIEDSTFSKIHTWIEKFRASFGVRSVDPMHIFAAINGNKLSFKNRTIRINAIFKALGSEKEYQEIDFTGCPAPNTTQILSTRPKEIQQEIWILFLKIYVEQKEVSEKDFINIKNWRGVETSFLTMFLFWIKSDDYLSLDANTTNFLKVSKLINKKPKTYNEYNQILTKIRPYNIQNTDIYGEKGLFREITKIAYDVIALKLTDSIFYTITLANLLEGKPNRPNTTSIDKEVKKVVNKHRKSRQFYGFKLIAIKPLNNCNKTLLNNLKTNKTYYFEQSFTIEKNGIKYHKDKDIVLFNQIEENKILEINVTAIVGKNGSGKSSLIELFYALINNIAANATNLIKDQNLELIPNLNIELYYLINGEVKLIKCENSKVSISKFPYDIDSDSYLKKGKASKLNSNDFDDFFYTIALNYSHYALNSKHPDYSWIYGLFHKNDSYQVPLVINPKRVEGNIDINVENSLVKYRLLSLLFLNEEDTKKELSIKRITEKQEVFAVSFTLNHKKNEYLFSKYINDKEQKIPFIALKTKEDSIANAIYKVTEIKKSINNNEVENEVLKYIIRKLVKIAVTYDKYKEQNVFDEINLTFDETKLEKYIGEVIKDPSHIAFKIKQAINYLKFKELTPRGNTFTLNIDKHRAKLDNFISSISALPIIELIPPSIFDIEITLKGGEALSSFDKLSSGEKQLIYSVYSILYHIVNIDSVNSDDSQLIGYRYINIVLDEIELYYHPDLQRKYLDYLLKMLGKLSLNKIEKINICLLTHSPYILSDIPHFFISKLENGKQLPNLTQSFGANIHDLLANEFLMNNGFMGEFASKKINEIIKRLEIIKLKKDTLNSAAIDKEKKEIKKIINCIGESLIRESILDLYNDAFFFSKELIDKEIEELMLLKQSIKL